MVGKALYINKVSRPDISNAVRQLSQHFDKPTLEHWKYLDKLISYLHSTKDIGLVMTRKGNDDNVMITGYCDSDYATEGDRKSITGYTVNLNGNTVAWKSKKQSCVTLSSTEAEYVAMSQCVTEMVFIRNLLHDMKVTIMEPMVLFEDNQGAIFLANNDTTGQWTKHIDIRYHFIRDLVNKNKLELKYMRSENNRADMLTKNVSEEKLTKFSKEILGRKMQSEGGC